MTPTKEMIEMAERIATEKNNVWGGANWWRSRDAALTAIMETSEKAAEFEARLCGYRQGLKELAIRNGEHLK